MLGIVVQFEPHTDSQKPASAQTALGVLNVLQALTEQLLPDLSATPVCMHQAMVGVYSKMWQRQT